MGIIAVFLPAGGSFIPDTICIAEIVLLPCLLVFLFMFFLVIVSLAPSIE